MPYAPDELTVTFTVVTGEGDDAVSDDYEVTFSNATAIPWCPGELNDVQPGKYPEEIKIPNTLETFQKYVCGSIESVRLDRDAYIICNDEGKLLPLPPNRLYGPTDFFAGPFLICGDGGEDLISLTDSQITKYEKKYHSPLIFLELYPKPITLKCTPELYAKCMGEEHQHDTQENEHDER